MQCMLGLARKCTAMPWLPLISLTYSSGDFQSLRTASLDIGGHHRLNGIAADSGMRSPAIGEAIGRGRIAGQHLALPVGRGFLQNLQLTATEGKAEHGNTIQAMYAPIMSLIMLVTQRDMLLGSRTINRAFPCVMAQGTKCAHFDVKCKPKPNITKSRNKTCMLNPMQPRHAS